MGPKSGEIVKKIPATLALATVLSVVACGAGNSSTGEGSDALTTVNVGVIPILDVAPIYLGEKQGFFAEEGLDLNLTQAQGGAAIVPSVVSGQMDIGFSNMTSLIVAKSKGLPLQVVTAGAGSNGEQGKDVGAVVAPSDSEIKTAKDLEGKKVAVNTLSNINDTTVRASVSHADGDPSKVDFVEIAFPDMLANLEKGNVDAAQIVEPFLSIAKEAGYKVVASNYVDAAENLTTAGYFTSAQIASSKPEVVEKFNAAMEKSLKHAQENPDDVRAVLPEYTKIDPKLVDSLILPSYPVQINKESVQTLADLAQQDGLTETPVDLEALLP